MNQKKVGVKNFLGHKNFGSKNILGKNFWFKKNLVKKFFGQIKFWVKKFSGQKSCFCGSKVFWVKIFGQKFFYQNDLDPNFFFVKKTKQVGLTQGGGYITPPPPEISRVKIVLDCCG